MVGKHVNNPFESTCNFYSNSDKPSINWSIISEQMNRFYMDCVWQYEKIRHATMKQGYFTADEDAIIRKRVEEWGNRGKGLWKSLEEELGRPGKSISQRWRKQLK